jgi:hypothetical protein
MEIDTADADARRTSAIQACGEAWPPEPASIQ